MTAAIITALLIALSAAAAADAHRTSKRPRWISPFAWAVAVCETGKGHNHPDRRHRSGPYDGAWGWYVGTWRLDAPAGYPRNPWDATLRQQHRVFQIGRKRGRYWGCIHNGGYRYWMP